MGTFVQMENIYKLFGGVCAINNVCFEIDKGEVIGLVGDNAAGKSTLMKVLAGVYLPTDGKIYVKGKKTFFHSPRDARNLGIEMLFQDLALIPELDVTDNLFLGKEISQKLFKKVEVKFILDKKTMKQKTVNFLKELEINIDSVDQKVKVLSGGQRQSVSIARTIFFNSELVILDEPTSAISVKETQKVLELILHLKEKGISAIIVSHRLDDIFKVADRIVVLKRGHKIEDVEKSKTTPEEIIKKIVGVESNNKVS